MAGRVEEHRERRTGLMVMLDGAELKHSCLRDIEVIDHDIEMHLLRHCLAGPLWRGEALDLLETQGVAVLGAHGPPFVVVALDSWSVRICGLLADIR